METNFRIILLLVGIFIVAGILWDTFRARRQATLKTRPSTKPKTKVQSLRRNTANAGQTRDFDENLDEVLEDEGHPGELLEIDPADHSKELGANADYPLLDEDDFEEEVVIVRKPKTHAKPTTRHPGNSISLSHESDPIPDHIIEDIQLEPEFEQFVDIQENENEKSHHRSTAVKSTNSSSTTSANSNTKTNASTSTSSTTTTPRSYQTPIVINLMARQPGTFQGRKLIDAFQEANLYYGEMQIFHYHENSDGSGDVLFSVISAVEPGIFEMSKMENFATPSLSFFFIPGRLNQSIASFEAMLRVAKQLAQRLDGELRNDQRKPLTVQEIDKYRDQIRFIGYKTSKAM
jgi:cell division protein ZipA